MSGPDARPDALHDPLVPLPAQPDGVAWPVGDWPRGELDARIDVGDLLESAFDDVGPLALTQAVLVVHGGRLVVERYQGALPFFDRPPEAVTAQSRLLSWSMAKSMLHAVVGLLVADGRLEVDQPAPVPEWAAPDDPRRAITIEHLLEMRDGLDFTENYIDAQGSDVITMLYGMGRDDVAHFAAERPLAAAPGRRFNYSSGTTNVLSGVVARLVGPGPAYQSFLTERLFKPLAMESAVAELDGAGTWVASSSVRATARDFARFGLCYLRGGAWAEGRFLPADWVDHGRRARSVDAQDGALHGAHWWVVDDGRGTFRAAGYEGQTITICPANDLVLVRLGKTPAEGYPALVEWRAAMVAAFDAARD